MSEEKRQWAWFWATLKDVGLDEPKAKELVQRNSFNEWLDNNPDKTQADLMKDILLEWTKVLLSDKPLASYPEAPASWNVRYFDPDGFDCQLTLRGMSGAELMPQTRKALDWLKGAKCIPQRGNSHAPAPQAASEPTQGTPVGQQYTDAQPPVCLIHHVAMQRSKHQAGQWYCPQKVGDHPTSGKALYCDQKVEE